MKPGLLMCMMFISSLIQAQNVIVSGKVTEAASGEALPGANIQIKGTSRGTTSDYNGYYQLSASEGDVLVFSFIGYKTVERPASAGPIDIALVEDAQQLGEVVVIGYGTTTVEDATGSLTSVGSKDFNKGNIITPENLLNGRVAGLTVNTGGGPGSGSTIRIRGGASLGASNDPLIVINGLPIDNNTIGGSRSVLSTINPNEIESFTVLKDASATAIYGSRASNGVIIITTKKASNELQVNLDMQAGISMLPDKVDVFTADEFRQVVAEQRPELLSLLGDANTDWQDEIYRAAFNYNTNLSVQGSILNKVPARISIGRSDQEGLRETSWFERNTVSVNLNPTLLDRHLKVNINANGTFEKNRFAAGEEGNAITFDPTQPVYDAESPFGGFFQYYSLNDDGALDVNDLTPNAPLNPVANLMQNRSMSEVQRIFGNVKLDYSFHFLPELSAVINLGIDDQTADGFERISSDNPIAQPDGSFVGSDSDYTNNQRNILFDGYLAYNHGIGLFDLDVTGGYSFQKFESDQYISGELLNDQPDSEPVLTVNTDLVLIGFFGRTNLSFDNRYLLTLSYRRDGTSRFSKNNRWGNFPAAAFAWKIMEEDFFPESEAVSSLKLRAGWGITGQQDIGRNNADLFLQRYARGLPASQYQFGNQVIPIGIPQYRNENLKWEETTTYNIGIDYGFLADRFSGSVEAFRKESKDLLANAAISDGSNFSNSGFQNVGNFTSKGLEFTVNGDVLRSMGGFNWNVNFNATFIKTEIKSLALDQDQEVGGINGGTGNTVQLHRVGYAPFSFYVYNQVYDESGRPIEGAYSDLNGDNIINNDDRYIYQNGAPDVTLGFLSNMTYKNFDFAFNLRASIGNYVYNNVNSSRAQYNLIQNNAVLSNLPAAVTESGFTTTEDVILSDYYMENASFLKVDNVTLGYTFNNVLVERASVRVSAGVQNVVTITNYSGLDPEVFGNGIDNTIYPRPRTFYLGANISF